MPALPIPRPNEITPANATPAPQTGVAPRPLGGGASYTSVEPGSGRRAGDADAVNPRGRLAWEVAAQLASGMLSNPARSHASVKDAMALFDQFLNEMHAYARIADAAAMRDSSEERRRAHSEYFRGHEAAEEAPSPPPKPAPARPRPAGDYRAIPPGARAQYPAPQTDERSPRDDRAA